MRHCLVLIPTKQPFFPQFFYLATSLIYRREAKWQPMDPRGIKTDIFVEASLTVRAFVLRVCRARFAVAETTYVTASEVVRVWKGIFALTTIRRPECQSNFADWAAVSSHGEIGA